MICINLVGVNRNIWPFVPFASEVGCKVAEVGFSGRFQVSVGTPDSPDTVGRGGKKGKVSVQNIDFFFDIIAFAYSSDTGLHAVVFNEMPSDSVIKCDGWTHTPTCPPSAWDPPLSPAT